MLCQNCNRNDAGVHFKRIINGESAEIHLCSSCAAALGVSDAFSGFSPLQDIIGGLLSSSDTITVSNRILRCDICGFSFDDVARTGRPGCPNCYRVFSRKLKPTLVKLHGRAVYRGKVPAAVQEENKSVEKIESLKVQLDEAVAEQNFELAAVLRDEIKALEWREGD